MQTEKLYQKKKKKLPRTENWLIKYKTLITIPSIWMPSNSSTLENLEKTHNFEKNALTQKQTEKQTTNKKDREDRKNYQHIAYKTLSVNTINLNVFINSLY